MILIERMSKEEMAMRSCPRNAGRPSPQEQRSIPRENERMETVRKLRKLMNEYQEALVLQKQVFKMQKPGNKVYDVYSK